MPVVGLVRMQRALETATSPSTQSNCHADWATRTREPQQCGQPCQSQTGENPDQGVPERVLLGPRTWAGEAVGTRQGAEGKPGRTGTIEGNFVGSLYSLSV